MVMEEKLDNYCIKRIKWLVRFEYWLTNYSNRYRTRSTTILKSNHIGKSRIAPVTSTTPFLSWWIWRVGEGNRRQELRMRRHIGSRVWRRSWRGVWRKSRN